MNEAIQAAEEAVVGACLLDPEKSLAETAERVRPHHFASLPLGAVYKAMLAMRYAGEKIDCVTLLPRLPGCGVSEESGKGLLVRCMEECPTVRNLDSHIQILLDGYKRRKAAEVAEKLLFGEGEDADGMISQAADTLAELITGNPAGGLKSMEELVVRDYASLFDRERLKSRLELGYACVDRIIDGIYPGDMFVLGARPAVGKTALVLDIAAKLAGQGKKIAFYSLEMSERQLLQRYVSNISGVELRRVKNANLDEVSGQIADGCDRLSKLPLFLNDKAYISVSDIRSGCRFLQGLGLIVIDYLQLLQPRPGQKYPNRAEAVGQISRDLKILAKELNVPVLVLSQLNRVNDEAKEPTLNDLRESGSIEQDADIVMLLWNSDPEDGLVGCKVAKNRNGGIGKACLRFDRERMRFESTFIKPAESRRKAAWEE